MKTKKFKLLSDENRIEKKNERKKDEQEKKKLKSEKAKAIAEAEHTMAT